MFCRLSDSNLARKEARRYNEDINVICCFDADARTDLKPRREEKYDRFFDTFVERLNVCTADCSGLPARQMQED